MIKRKLCSNTYRRIGSPDLGCVIFFKKDKVRRWGKIIMIEFLGKDMVHLGLDPFKPLKK